MATVSDSLLIPIGADLSVFTASLKTAEKQFSTALDRLNTNTKKSKMFGGMAADFAKEMGKVEKEAAASFKKIKDLMSKANPGLTKEQIADYARAYEIQVRNINKLVDLEKAKRTKIINDLARLGIKADKRRTTINLENQLKASQQLIRQNNALYAKKKKMINEAYDYEERRQKVLWARRLQTIRREEADRKKMSDAIKAKELANYRQTQAGSQTSRWGNIESISHAAKTTALYGAMAQALYGFQNAVVATMASIIYFDDMIQQNMGVLNMSREAAIGLGHEVERLGIKYGLAFNDIQESMLALGRAGLQSDELSQYAEQVVALATITGDTLNDSAEAIVSYKEVYREMAKDVVTFSGRMAYVVNETILGMRDMKVIGNYALSAAASINLSYDSLMGLAGAFSKIGKQPSTIGTSIRRMGDIALSTSSNMQAAWRKFGIDQEKLQANFATGGEVAEDALKGVVEQLGKIKNQDPTRFMEGLEGLNVRTKELLSSLAQVSDSMTGTFTKFSDKNALVDAIAQAELVAQSFSKQWTSTINVFKASWTDAGISFMEEFTPILKSLTEEGPDGAMDFAEAVRVMSEVMLESISTVITAVGYLVSAFVLADAGFKKIVGSIGMAATSSMKDLLSEKKKLEYELKGAGKNDFRITSPTADWTRLKELETNIKGLAKSNEYFKNMRIEGDEATDAVFALNDKVSELTTTLNNVKVGDGVHTALNKAKEGTDKVTQSAKATGDAAKELNYTLTDSQKIIVDNANAMKQVRDGTITAVQGQKLLLQNRLDLAKKLYDAEVATNAISPSNDRTKEIQLLQRYGTAQDAMFQNANRASDRAIKDAEKLAKVNKSGTDDAAKAARRADKDAKDKIKNLILEKKIEFQIAKAQAYASGKGMSEAQQYAFEASILDLRKKQAIETMHLAGANIAGAKSYEEYQKTVLAYYKIITEENKEAMEAVQDLRDTISSGIEDGFAAILNGDLVGAWQGLFKDVLTEAVSFVAKYIAQTLIASNATAVLGVATQSIGEPYSAWIRMAAMAATMAGMGLVTGFGGGGSSGKVSQAQLDTAEGTSFDDDYTSDMVAILEMLEENSSLDLEYTSQMADSLKTLVDMSGKASMALGNTLSGSEYVAEDGGGMTTNRSTELLSKGVMISPTSMADLEKGYLNAVDYQAELITDSNWLGEKQSIGYTGLGETTTEFQRAYSAALVSGLDAVNTAAMSLGVSQEEITAFTAGWTTIMQELNFEGMDAAQRQELIISSLGANIDSYGQMISSLDPYIEKFQTGGEAYTDTLIRLGMEYELVGRSLKKIGIVLPEVSEGGLDMAEALIKGAGGLDKFNASMQSYIETVYSDEEQIAMKTSMLQAQFKALGYTLPTTTAGLRALVEGELARVQAQQLELNAYQAVIQATYDAAMASTVLSQAQINAAQIAYDSAMINIAASQALIDSLSENIGKLMALTPDWASLYGTRQSEIDEATRLAEEAADAQVRAAEEAAAAMEEAAQVLEGIVDLLAEWSDSLEGAQDKLNAVIEATGIMGVTYENFMGQFERASNMGMTSDQLADWQALSAALKALHDAVIENTKVQEGGTSVIGIRQAWGVGGQDQAMADSVARETGLVGLTVENFLQRFNEAVKAGLTVEEFAKWQQMSDVLGTLRDVQLDSINAQIDFYTTLLETIENAYLGSLSYLNSAEKAIYSAQIAASRLAAGDTQGYFDALGDQLEYEKKMSITKEEYIPMFERYIDELKMQEPEKTTDDVVDELEDLNDKIDELTDAIEKAAYQGVFT